MNLQEEKLFITRKSKYEWEIRKTCVQNSCLEFVFLRYKAFSLKLKIKTS